ncbi:MAG: hypothetical protein HZB46_06590 [Solirubrobacterales bacterium]|nr:hypothetical protein [Solirubrobacterales bacterium]
MSAHDGSPGESAARLFAQLMAEVAGREVPRLRPDEALRALEDAGDRGLPAAGPQMRAAVARAIDLYADLFRETFSVYADLVDLTATGRGGAAGAPVSMVGARGGEARSPVWLHNQTASPLSDVALRVTDLAAHDGALVAGARGAFSPPVLDIPAGASASATLALPLPAEATPGSYHGLVLASGLPSASVPVLLVVE